MAFKTKFIIYVIFHIDNVEVTEMNSDEFSGFNLFKMAYTGSGNKDELKTGR